MLGANVMWGLMAPIVKIVLASGVVAPLLLVDFRMAGAAALFWLTSLFMPREHVPLPDLLRLFGAGMLGVLFNQGCFIVGVSLTTPGEASLVTTTMPMWVMLLAWLLLREPISLKKAGGIVLGASGALILMMGSASSSDVSAPNPALGDFVILMAQLSYALYLTLYRNFIRRYSLVTLMKWMFLSASLIALPVTSPIIAATDWGAITPTDWLRGSRCCRSHLYSLYMYHDRSEKPAAHYCGYVQLRAARNSHGGGHMARPRPFYPAQGGSRCAYIQRSVACDRESLPRHLPQRASPINESAPRRRPLSACSIFSGVLAVGQCLFCNFAGDGGQMSAGYLS